MIYLHLVKEASLGEFIDGLVSGLWFTAAFLLGILLAVSGRPESRRRKKSIEIVLGASAGLIAWLLLWGFWELPTVEALKKMGLLPFILNTGAMLAFGLAFSLLNSRGRIFGGSGVMSK